MEINYTLYFSAYFEKVIKQNDSHFVTGKATLSVVDKHGKHYIVNRIYGEQSNVIDENGLLEKLVGGKIGKSAGKTSEVC